jgi:hypothetical protein
MLHRYERGLILSCDSDPTWKLAYAETGGACTILLSYSWGFPSPCRSTTHGAGIPHLPSSRTHLASRFPAYARWLAGLYVLRVSLPKVISIYRCDSRDNWKAHIHPFFSPSFGPYVMASISSTMASHPGPFESSDTFRSYPMSSFPHPLGRPAQHEELFRRSPTHAASAPLRPVNLPPLSSIDPRQQQPSHPPSPADAQHKSQQPGLSGPIPHGALLPNTSQYYGSQLNTNGQYIGRPSPPGAVASSGSRFPIALTSDPNSMISSSSRHKKEVKKRTKTGCMTCRKRRIKVGNP